MLINLDSHPKTLKTGSNIEEQMTRGKDTKYNAEKKVFLRFFSFFTFFPFFPFFTFFPNSKERLYVLFELLHTFSRRVIIGRMLGQMLYITHSTGCS